MARLIVNQSLCFVLAMYKNGVSILKQDLIRSHTTHDQDELFQDPEPGRRRVSKSGLHRSHPALPIILDRTALAATSRLTSQISKGAEG
ncbi:hypothetical protein DIRU0_B13388 [Diutina rugosa]